MDKKTITEEPVKASCWLNKKQMAESCRRSVQGFDKWGVSPVKKIGRETFYTVADVLENRERKWMEQTTQNNNRNEERDDFIDVEYERGRKLRAEADAQEMKNAITRKEQAPTSLLEWALAKVCEQISGLLASIPIKIKKRLPHLKASEIEIIHREIVKARNAASRSSLPWDQLEND